MVEMTSTATLCDGVMVMLLVMLKMVVNDSNRNTVSPSLAVRPRLSQDQQRRGLPLVTTLEVNLEHFYLLYPLISCYLLYRRHLLMKFREGMIRNAASSLVGETRDDCQLLFNAFSV